MEEASLTRAHIHARNALAETERADPVAASEEHDLAASEFAAAVEDCNDPQAIRMLRLLENHHKRLADVLKFQHKHPVTKPQQSDPSNRLSVMAEAHAKAFAPELNGMGPANQPSPPVSAGRGQSRLGRSIASDLASARGIRREVAAHGRTSERATEAKQTKRNAVSTPSHKGGNDRDTMKDVKLSRQKPPWAPIQDPPGVVYPTFTSTAAKRRASAKELTENTSPDDPFNRFYATFGGLITKISAPLAFAGLPLVDGPAQNKASPPPESSPTPRGPHCFPQNPNLTNLLSPAALQAINDDSGSGMPAVNPMESFYVVPTSGGTMSYAGIVAKNGKQQQQNSQDADNDFVDLVGLESNEKGGSPQTTTSTDRRAHSATTKKHKTLEELQLENEKLKKTSDDLARRLQMWEANSQSSTLALHQSFRAMQTAQTTNVGSPVQTSKPPLAVIPPVDNEADGSFNTSRIRELERTLKNERDNYERVRRENEKLTRVIARYRDRWEKLKAGARTRREANQELGKGSGQSGVTDALPEEGSREESSDTVEAVNTAAQQN